MTYRCPPSHLTVDPIEERINETIEHIILLLHSRRAQLFLEANVSREIVRANEESRKNAISELERAPVILGGKMKLNPLYYTREILTSSIASEGQELRRIIPVETRSEWVCDLGDIEASIRRLGRIAEVPLGVPHYETFHTSKVATGKKGGAPGELERPYGVAIHERSNQICVANQVNHRVELFSEGGEYIAQLGEGELNAPYGIATHEDYVYVTCWDHTINKLSLTDKNLVKKRGSYGSGNGQFDYPNQLTIDRIGCIYIADTDNDRICVYGTDLFHHRSIKHETMSKPFDVKVSNDQLYVLCPKSNPCIHVITLRGVMKRSLITCGRDMDVSSPRFFCLDKTGNIVISDQENHLIRVFSSEGNPLHRIGREGHEKGSFYQPQGVAIDPNGNLVCVSNNKNSGVQIFY